MIRTRRQARAFLLKYCLASSMRKKARMLTITELPKGTTPSGMEKVRRELLTMADEFEAKSAKMNVTYKEPTQ